MQEIQCRFVSFLYTKWLCLFFLTGDFNLTHMSINANKLSTEFHLLLFVPINSSLSFHPSRATSRSISDQFPVFTKVCKALKLAVGVDVDVSMNNSLNFTPLVDGSLSGMNPCPMTAWKVFIHPLNLKN